MKIKISELTGAALDWAVCKAGGGGKDIRTFIAGHTDYNMYHYSTNWVQGGPVIEREGISLTQFSDYPQWTAKHPSSIDMNGETPLIAAMRAYVSSKLGSEVEVPEELLR